MRATLEIQFNGGWIDLPVDYSYGVEDDGTMTLGPITPMGGLSDITSLLDDYQREYMLVLCRKDWAHHLSCQERSRKARQVPQDIIDECRADHSNDLIGKARNY